MSEKSSTSIPACIIVIDKENAEHRKGIFMVDAGKGFIKDGNKNRLREQDIHKIVDVFSRMEEIPGYSRVVPITEISDKKNDFNLNIPRYIESQETDDIQDIEAHLLGGIPNRDIEALNDYWKILPSVQKKLIAPHTRANYSQIIIPKEDIKKLILTDPDFKRFQEEMGKTFGQWKQNALGLLNNLTQGCHPKEVIFQLSEDLLKAFKDSNLIDKYDLYQHLMNYWNDVMQDDCYLIAADGWKAEVYRILVENKKGTKVDKGWACDLIPAELIINRYFPDEKEAIEELEAKKETIVARIEELEEEHGGEEGYFADMEKVNKAVIQKRLKEITSSKYKAKTLELQQNLVAENGEAYNTKSEKEVLEEYLTLNEDLGKLTSKIKEVASALDKKVLAQYDTLTEPEIKQLVLEDKWMTSIEKDFNQEMERITQRLTQRLKELAERYDTTLPQINKEVVALEEKVNAHLLKMGFE